MCPQCNAPLSPRRFARSIVCSFCGATVLLDEASVSAADFREAFRRWNSPGSYGFSSWISLGEHHWAVEGFIASGDISDVYLGRRARFPTELAVLKLLRNRQDAADFDHEWDILQALLNSSAPGAEDFSRLLPQPILHGDVTVGDYAGRRAGIFRRAIGFQHTLAEVIQAYPQGINPQASIWVWRRVLEVLSFIHASGLVHGAVLPRHLLIQENEHGVRLVGYCAAGRIGGKARCRLADPEGFSPPRAASRQKLAPQIDLAMSARCLAAALGGDPATASLPENVPGPLAELVRRVAQADASASLDLDAWTLREELGRISDQVYGPPAFVPIVMPSGS